MILEGKVAAIVSVREVAINLGDKDDVEPGMIFAILADVPLRVEDPDTRELLGQIERYKVKVKVTEVLERLSICRTYEIYETPGLFPFLPLIPPMVATRRVRTLRIEDSELPPPLSDEESYVKVGDRVRQVPSED
ncbi:MAG: hypothetical protein MUP14_05695 [Dehalococcoidia bacterium]|nr:hypothetical protein [Dehalococcoidia bacterium]